MPQVKRSSNSDTKAATHQKEVKVPTTRYRPDLHCPKQKERTTQALRRILAP